MKKILRAAPLALISGVLFGQAPTITAVLDAGGYSAGIAPGSVFVVKGSNLCGTSSTANATAAPYSTAAMGGATIRFTPAGGGSPLDAYMIYCYNASGTTQLAGELPNAAAPGNYNVTVTFNGSTSTAFATTVVARKFQLMTLPSNGSGRALLQNVVSQSQYDLNGFTTGPVSGQSFSRSPARPSEFLVAWGTGLGSAAGFDASAPGGGYDFIAQQHLDVKVLVGGISVTPAYAGRSNLFPGLDNISFQLPANVPTGCSVPVQVSVAGQLSNVATIAIAPGSGASACVDPQFTSSVLSKLDAGGAITAGYFNLTSLNTSFSGQSIRVEGASGSFARYTGDMLTRLPNLASAANGTCQVYTATTSTSGSGGAGAATDLTYLDAGSISLNGPNVTNKAFTKTGNVYSLSLSQFPPAAGSTPLISSGTYTLTGAGGADVGPFNASITIGQPLSITGGLPATVNRSQDLNLAWTGGTSTDVVVIAGTSSVLASGTLANGILNSTTFICTTTAGKQSFVVPSSILSALPATPAGEASVLSVFSTSAPTSGNGFFTAPLTAGGNTDFGLFTAGVGSFATTTYQ